MHTTAQTDRAQYARAATAAAAPDPVIANIRVTRPIPTRTQAAIDAMQSEIDAVTGRIVQARECGKRDAQSSLMAYRAGLEAALLALASAYR